MQRKMNCRCCLATRGMQKPMSTHESTCGLRMRERKNHMSTRTVGKPRRHTISVDSMCGRAANTRHPVAVACWLKLVAVLATATERCDARACLPEEACLCLHGRMVRRACASACRQTRRACAHTHWSGSGRCGRMRPAHRPHIPRGRSDLGAGLLCVQAVPEALEGVAAYQVAPRGARPGFPAV